MNRDTMYMEDSFSQGMVVINTDANAGFTLNNVSLSANPASGERINLDWEPWLVQLNEWSQFAGEEDEDGIVWPTMAAIRAAAEVLQRLRSRKFPQPTSVLPSGDGGIGVSYRIPGRVDEFTVSDVGECEVLVFEQGKLVSRKAI